MSNQYDDARQDVARSTPEPDNEPLSSRARTPLGTTHQLTAKRSQYNQPERETTMSDENTNISNPEVQPVNSEPLAFHCVARIADTLSYETLCGRTVHRDCTGAASDLLNEQIGLEIPGQYLTCPQCARAYQLAREYRDAALTITGNEEQ